MSQFAVAAEQAFKSTPLDGGTLNIVVGQTSVFVRNFNPYVQNARQTSRHWMYEPLLVFNTVKAGEFFPRLASAYALSDDLSWVDITLRKDLTWSDGAALTLEDVLFTFDYLRQHPVLDFLGIGGLVSRVEALDADRFRVYLKVPGSTAITKIAELMPLPKHIWQDIKQPLFFMNADPVGSGPFTELRTFTPFVYTQCRNPHYWQPGKPHIDCLRNIQFSDNDQAVAAARRGDIDWMGTFIGSPEKEYVRDNVHNRYWHPAYEPTNIHLNTTKAPFNDLRFRKAFSLALDRTEMVEIAAFGLPVPSDYPIGIGVYHDAWIDKPALAAYSYLMNYDPDLAAEILDKSGYIDRDKDGWRDQPDGGPISITLSAPAGWNDWTNVLATAVRNLKAIQIEARLLTPDEDAWYEMINSGEGDGIIMWTELGNSPWHSYWTLFNPDGMTKGKVNLTQFHQYQYPEVVELLAEFGQSTELRRQKQLISRVQRLVAEQLPIIHLFSNPGWFQYSSARFQGWANEENAYIRPYIQNDVPERLIHLLGLSLKPGVVPR